MISIVIPLYNKAHTIKRTLGSVLAQTFKDFEVVIVNDGSTDNGVNVIHKFTNDKRIKIIEQENQGVSVARNQGVFNSKYNYIAFLDGDDEWLPEYLEYMHKSILKYPKAGFICCAGIIKTGNIELIRLAKKYENQITEINFFENPHVFLHTSATVVLKSEFNKAGGFPLGMKRNQDFALFFSLALITNQIVYCGKPLSVYVGDVEGQATTKPIEEVIHHVIKRFNLVFKTWKTENLSSNEYLIFLKYELRHMFLSMIKKKDYVTLIKFINGLDNDMKKIFIAFELKLYKNDKISFLAKILIYFTKIRWRLRGYPRVK